MPKLGLMKLFGGWRRKSEADLSSSVSFQKVEPSCVSSGEKMSIVSSESVCDSGVRKKTAPWLSLYEGGVSKVPNPGERRSPNHFRPFLSDSLRSMSLSTSGKGKEETSNNRFRVDSAKRSDEADRNVIDDQNKSDRSVLYAVSKSRGKEIPERERENLETPEEVSSANKSRVRRYKRRTKRRHRSSSVVPSSPDYSTICDFERDYCALNTSFESGNSVSPRYEKRSPKAPSRVPPPLLRQSTDFCLTAASRSVSTVQLNKKVVPTFFLESADAMPDPDCILRRLGHSLDSQLEDKQSTEPDPTTICVVWDLENDAKANGNSHIVHHAPPPKTSSSSEEASPRYSRSESKIESARKTVSSSSHTKISSPNKLNQDSVPYIGESNVGTRSFTLLTLPEIEAEHGYRDVFNDQAERHPSPYPRRCRGFRSLPSSPKVFSPESPSSRTKNKLKDFHEDLERNVKNILQKNTKNSIQNCTFKTKARQNSIACDPTFQSHTNSHQQFNENVIDNCSDFKRHSVTRKEMRRQCSLPVSPSGANVSTRKGVQTPVLSLLKNRRRTDGLRDSAYFSTDDGSESGKGRSDVSVNPQAAECIKTIIEKSINESLNTLPGLIASEVNRQVKQCIRSSTLDLSTERKDIRERINYNVSKISSRSLDLLDLSLPYENEYFCRQDDGPSNFSNKLDPVPHSNSCNDLLDTTPVLSQGAGAPPWSSEKHYYSDGSFPSRLSHPRSSAASNHVYPLSHESDVFARAGDETADADADADVEAETAEAMPRKMLQAIDSFSFVEEETSSEGSDRSMEWDYSFLKEEEEDGMWPCQQ